MADKKAQRFDFDPASDGNEVPTLTSLLYKKNVVKAQGSPGQNRAGRGLDAGRALEQDRSRIMTLEPTVTLERPMPSELAAIPIEIDPSSGQFVHSEIGSNQPQPQSMGNARIASSDRRIMAASTPFTMPDVLRAKKLAQLPAGESTTPGLQTLFGKAKLQAGLVFEDTGPSYTLRTIVAESSERSVLWTGMEISKESFADLVGRLQKFGFAEFPPVGAAGKGNFDRTAFRVGFQVKATEWITLVKTRSANGSDAVLAFLSPGSIQMHLPEFHSAGMPAAKAA